jgi:Cu2+-exporting ATPase
MAAEALSRAMAFAPANAASCAHCGNEVQRALFETGSERQFCCSGCRSVFAILNEAGLDAYYRHREESGATGRPALTTEKNYTELDQPEFVSLHCRRSGTPGSSLLATELYLEGVHCSACLWLVEKVSALVPGVSEARLDLSRSVLRVAWDPGVVQLSVVARKLDSLGYPCHAIYGLDREAVQRREDRALLTRIGVAGASAGNAMLLAIALYCGAFDGIEQSFVDLFRFASAAVALPSLLWSAAVFYRGAFAALRTRTPHMDLPITIGILVGSASGVVNIVRSRGEIYFDTLTMLVFLLLIGRYLQRRQQRRADAAAELVGALAPATARLVDGETTREIPVEAVPANALVEVRAGEHVPIDGLVAEGSSSIDSALLTGESVPEDVGVGARVNAGCINISNRILVRAEQTGRETRVARLVRSMEEAASRRAPIVIAANRLSGYFVCAVLGIAVLTALFWWRHDPSRAVDRVVALLVVTCPCALGLATPLAVSAALGKAARRGLLVKGGEFLEALARPGLVVFDKTGTLTVGKLAVLEYIGDHSASKLVQAVEARSAHPIARALAVALDSDSSAEVTAMCETTGRGIEATVNGRRVVVGSEPFVAERHRIPPWARTDAARLANSGTTPVLAAVDGDVRAILAVGDPVRPDARPALEALRRMGYRLAILSGDQPAVVRAVAKKIGVEFDEMVGGATPEEKLSFVERRASTGSVVMVGDGVNDAAALSAATVGVAVRGGAEASLQAADVFATRDGLEPLVELVVGARRTLEVIRGGLLRSLVYNLAVGTLAAVGVVGPLLAAVLMPVSSLTVVANSYRVRTFGQSP